MIRSAAYLALALLVVACGDDATTGAGGGTTGAVTSTTGGVVTGAGGMDCGPVPAQPPTDACRACMADKCCAEGQACRAEPACDALATCAESCGDDEACFVASCKPLGAAPAAQVPFLELARCELSSCGAECAIYPFCGEVPPPDTEPGCGACMESQCCDEAQAAYTLEWMDLVLCQAGCLDWVCLHDCELSYAGAVKQQNDVLECFVGPQCGASCTGGPQCGLLGSPEPTCDDCLVEACCGALAGVSTFESFDYLQCYNTCQGPGDCATECATLWGPADAAPVSVVLNCLRDQCFSACGAPASGCGQSSLLVPDGCSACIRDNCCDAGTACGGDLACTSLEICIHLCATGDAACRGDCEAQFPAGVTAYEALETCTTASCDADCP